MNTPSEPVFPAPSDPASAADEGLYEALLRADRSESLMPLASGLAKELNEALTRILSEVSAARKGSDPAALLRAEEACLAARDATRRLFALARGADSSRKSVTPRELLDEAAKTAAAGSTVEVSVEAADRVDPVWADPELITQVFRNLIRNAIEAMSPAPRRPRVHLRAANATLAAGQIEGLNAGDYVEFEVRDNGAGIPPANLEKIWAPFFTTKLHGAGLGLSTSLEIVRRHGGQIGVDSSVGVGTVFTVFLPRASSEGAVRAGQPPSKRFRTGRVLAMDDDPGIRQATGSLLKSLDYTFDLARNGEDAVSIYRSYFGIGRPHDALLLDLDVVGGMGGREALSELLRIDPDVRAVAVGNGDAEALSADCLALGFCAWLSKPYRLSELGGALKAALG